jgi:hypothetical protein
MSRSTLALPIARVRELAAAGTADYSDDAIEAVLDRNRRDFADDVLSPLREYDAGGTVRYFVHQSQFRNLEATQGGTAVLYVRNAAGARIGTASYSVDTQAGRITFVADTAGTVYYLTGRTYDVYAAAAEVWRLKAAEVAQRFDFTADGASFKASQLLEQYNKMADQCSAMATFGQGAAGLRSSTMVRDDLAQPDVWR